MEEGHEFYPEILGRILPYFIVEIMCLHTTLGRFIWHSKISLCYTRFRKCRIIPGPILFINQRNLAIFSDILRFFYTTSISIVLIIIYIKSDYLLYIYNPINLEEPNRLPSSTWINSSVCLSVHPYIPAD